MKLWVAIFGLVVTFFGSMSFAALPEKVGTVKDYSFGRAEVLPDDPANALKYANTFIIRNRLFSESLIDQDHADIEFLGDTVTVIYSANHMIPKLQGCYLKAYLGIGEAYESGHRFVQPGFASEYDKNSKTYENYFTCGDNKKLIKDITTSVIDEKPFMACSLTAGEQTVILQPTLTKPLATSYDDQTVVWSRSVIERAAPTKPAIEVIFNLGHGEPGSIKGAGWIQVTVYGQDASVARNSIYLIRNDGTLAPLVDDPANQPANLRLHSCKWNL